jgi:hypothetical protein
MFALKSMPRGKYSDVVMLLWYHLVPWNTDLSSCWRTMQESHHWFPSILCNSIAPQHPSTIERKMRCHWLQTSTMVWWSCCTASTCFIATLIRHASAALFLFYDFSKILAPIILLNQCRCLQIWLTMLFELFNGRSVKILLCCVHFMCSLLSGVPVLPNPKVVRNKHTTANVAFGTNTHSQICTEHFIF